MVTTLHVFNIDVWFVRQINSLYNRKIPVPKVVKNIYFTTRYPSCLAYLILQALYYHNHVGAAISSLMLLWYYMDKDDREDKLFDRIKEKIQDMNGKLVVVPANS